MVNRMVNRLICKILMVIILVLVEHIPRMSSAAERVGAIPINFTGTVFQAHRDSIRNILEADEGTFLRQTIKNIHDHELLLDAVQGVFVNRIAEGSTKTVYRVELLDKTGNDYVFAMKLVKDLESSDNNHTAKEIQALQTLSDTGLVSRFGAVFPSVNDSDIVAFTTEFIDGITVRQLQNTQPELASDYSTIYEIVRTWTKAWSSLGIGLQEQASPESLLFLSSDVNPGNIMYRQENGVILPSPVIVDLGCCRRMGPVDVLSLLSSHYAGGLDVDKSSFRAVLDGMATAENRQFFQGLLKQVQQLKAVLIQNEFLAHSSAQGSLKAQLDSEDAKIRQVFVVDYASDDEVSSLGSVHFDATISDDQQTLIKKILFFNDAAFLRKTVQNLEGPSLSWHDTFRIKISFGKDLATKTVYRAEVFNKDDELFLFALNVFKPGWMENRGIQYEVRAMEELQGTGLAPRLGAAIQYARKDTHSYLAYSGEWVEGLTVQQLWHGDDSVRSDEKVADIAKTFMSAWLIMNRVEIEEASAAQQSFPALSITDLDRHNIMYRTKNNRIQGSPIILDFRSRKPTLKPLAILMKFAGIYAQDDALDSGRVLALLNGFADALGNERAPLFFHDAFVQLESMKGLVHAILADKQYSTAFKQHAN